MVTLEAYFGGLVGIFAVIGLVRGFLKELGLTTVLLVWLFALDLVLPRMEELIETPGSFLQRLGLTPETDDMFMWLFFSVLTFIVVFIASHGETLAFGGTAPKGLLGGVFALLIGLVNGYLASGTLWWIMDRFNYPLRGLVFPFSGESLLSPLANNILNVSRLLPPDLLAGGMDEPGTLGILPVLLITLVLLRVFR